MAGRNKEPLSVILGKGKSNHLTKAEIARREKQEEGIKGFTDNIEPPAYLTSAQKKDFIKIAKELVRLNIFSNLDVDSLARYVDSKDQYVKLIKALRKIKPTIEVEMENGVKIPIANETYTKLMRSKNILFTECRSAASDLGLSITSRLKLVIPKTEDDKPKSEAQKRFGGRL